MNSVEQEIAADRAAVNEALKEICATRLSGVHPVVAEAMRYSILGDGKRLRGVLLMSAYRAAGGTHLVAELAAALEVVHAYSLVHDDLPCMDDDDVRRGRPTVHKVYGVAAATAAGLAMVPLAARHAHHASRAIELPEPVCGAIVRELMQAAGAGGMIGGQLLDLEGEGTDPTLEALERIHRLKTGSLITASVRLGGIAAQARPEILAAMTRYGSAVGLAYQIADDLLDVTASTDELGKTAGRDQALNKSTYPAVLGVDGASVQAGSLVDEGCTALSNHGLLTPAMEHLARFVVARRS